MLFGSLIKGITLPEFIYVFGLVLFVYCTALETGPSFFSSFTKQKAYINLLIIVLLVLSASSMVIMSKFSYISIYHAAGTFAGAHTNTPALAAVLEQIKKIPSATSLPDSSIAPVVGYGIAYPLGVLIVIALFTVFSRFIPDEKEYDVQERRNKGSLQVKNLVINNPGICNVPYKEITAHHANGFTISRGIIKSHLMVITPETTFSMGDVVVVVGDEKGLREAKTLFGGKEASIRLEQETSEIVAEKIFLSKKMWAGIPYQELHTLTKYNIAVTRISRGGIDMVVQPDTIFELGDQLTVVGESKSVALAKKEFGGDMKSLAEVNFVSLGLGIIGGILVGMVAIPLPTGGSFQLGNAGGPLVVGLILGFLGRTKSINWRQPQHVNYLLKEIGIILFLAGIGIRTGAKFGETIMTPLGLQILFLGACLTFGVTLIMIALCWKVFHIPWSGIMGIVSGMQTQPACLAYANQQTKSNSANIWYASVYPAATAAKILLAQLIVQSFM